MVTEFDQIEFEVIIFATIYNLKKCTKWIWLRPIQSVEEPHF